MKEEGASYFLYRTMQKLDNKLNELDQKIDYFTYSLFFRRWTEKLKKNPSQRYLFQLYLHSWEIETGNHWTDTLESIPSEFVECDFCNVKDNNRYYYWDDIRKQYICENCICEIKENELDIIQNRINGHSNYCSRNLVLGDGKCKCEQEKSHNS